MSDYQDDGTPQDAEPTLYDSLRTRWYVAAIAGVVVIFFLGIVFSGAGDVWLRSIMEMFAGPQIEPATEEPAPALTEETPPPTDTPTATATAEASDPTTESAPVAEVGDGDCNAPCDPAASNCLVGLSCLPVSAGSANHVCWNTDICSPVTVTATAGVTPGITGTPVSGCGNGVCDPGEHSYNCSADCGAPPPLASCGDGTCNGSESSANCPGDCGTVCGDGACNGGEAPSNCTADCGCGACGSAGCSSINSCLPVPPCGPLCIQTMTCYDYCGQCSSSFFCY